MKRSSASSRLVVRVVVVVGSASSRLVVRVVVVVGVVVWGWQHGGRLWERGRAAGMTKGEEVGSKRRRDRRRIA